MPRILLGCNISSFWYCCHRAKTNISLLNKKEMNIQQPSLLHSRLQLTSTMQMERRAESFVAFFHIVYSLMILHCWASRDVSTLVLLVGSSFASVIVNLVFLIPSLRNTTTLYNNKEKFILILTMLSFSVRFFLLDGNKIVLLPICLMVISSNQLTTPTKSCHLPACCFTVSHYLFEAGWKAWNAYQLGGMDRQFSEALTCNISIALAIVIYTQHMFIAFEKFNEKVRKVEETSKMLVSALDAKSTFIRLVFCVNNNNTQKSHFTRI